MKTAVIDSRNVRACFVNFSQYLKRGYKQAEKSGFFGKNVSHIVICGMGGSAIPGFVLQDFFKSESKVPIFVENSYSLPLWVDDKTLAVMVTFSGKTEETLSCLKEAKEKNCVLRGISSDPAFKELVPETLLVPTFFPQTRYSFPYIFSSLLFLLEQSCGAKDKKTDLFEAANFIESENLNMEAFAKKLAPKLKDKMVHVVPPHHLKSVGLRWLQDLNENSKSFGFMLYLSELDHNEINAVHGLDNGVALFWTEAGEDLKTRRRREISEQIYRKVLPVIEIPILGKNLLQKTVYSALLGSWISYYLAQEYKEDPNPVPRNELLKKEMAKTKS